MQAKTIRLQPFDDRAAVELDLTCSACRRSRLLQLAFRLQGDLKALSIPPPAERPARRHRLWENTCLECFLTVAASRAYWEFNLSPAGHWNLYRFDDYRRGMREENAVPEPVRNMQRTPNLLGLECTIDLDGLKLNRQVLLMGFAAVIRSGDGGSTYWAAVHPGPKPDFHRRESFILKMVPSKRRRS